VGLVCSSLVLLAALGALLWQEGRAAARRLPVAYRFYDSTGRRLDAGAPSHASSPVNVILISLDTLGARHLHVYGNPRPTSPSIDRLAAEGVRFANAFSHAPKTSPSHMSLFTSLYPSVHKITNGMRQHTRFALDHRLITLAEILRHAGYTTAAFTGGGNLDGALGFADGFDRYDDDDNLWESAFAWLDAQRDEPFFLFLHTYKVHAPYLPEPPYDEMFGEPYDGGILDTKEDLVAAFRSRAGPEAVQPGLRRLFWEHVDRSDPRDVQRLIDLYDGGVRFTSDRLIEALLQRLRERRLLERSLVVLTSDHGEEFGQHGGFSHHDLYDEDLHVPLIVRFPDATELNGRVVEQPVSHVDVVPTVLDHLGLPPPAQAQGISLLPLIEGRDVDRPVFSEITGTSDGGAKAIRTARWKYLWTPGTDRRELYDLAADPGERTNRVRSEPLVAARLHAELAAWMATNEQRGASVATHDHRPSERTLDRLRSLGYVE
jgi:arylsulfatase A-like enzyme